jgi:rhodanese-related sulfurtransferase
MKKFLLIFVMAFAMVSLFACQTAVEEPDYTLPEVITMENLDDYINYPNVEVIDLRNWQDKMNGGYIRGSHFIPFFQYLESEEILVRLDGWNFSADAIKDENALRNIFDEEMNIILLCAGGTRAGFVMEALLELGYENVWNIGGFGDYSGDYKVFGDGSYIFPPAAE